MVRAGRNRCVPRLGEGLAVALGRVAAPCVDARTSCREESVTLASRDDAVEEIRRRIDIVELVGRYVKLKKSGSNHLGLCPFHAEKTPSFSVSSRKGFYHCFGCKASGDIFSFLMQMEGKTFPEALEELAAQAGVELPRRETGDGRSRALKQRLLELNELAAAYYQHQLWHHREAARARAHLQQRGLDEDIVRRFRLGYAPEGWNNLVDHLRGRSGAQQVSLTEAQSLGLLAEGNRGHYDLFRDRLVFPIVGLGGKVIGFGARKLNDDQEGPKYINSRQSRVFDKSEVLYGLQQARRSVQASGSVVLVEGYFDVLALVQAGVDHTVATCGTALTETHARVLHRFTQKVITVFDADEAGMSASRRAAVALLRENLGPYMVSLPAGEDPDSFIRSRQAGAFQAMLEAARPTVEILAEQGLREAGSDVEARTAALRDLVPLLAACDDAVRSANYLRMVADRFDLPEAEVHRAVQGHRAGQRRRDARGTRPAPGSEAPATGPVPDAAGALHADEEMCLVLMIKYPHLAARLDDNAASDALDSPRARSLAGSIRAAGAASSPAALLAGIEEPQLRQRLGAKVMDDEAYPEDKADSLLADCMQNIRKRRLREKLRRLNKDIHRAVQEGRDAERRRLQRDKIQLNREIAALDVPVGKSP